MKKAGESLEMQNNCAEIKIRAERRIGEFSKGLPKQKNQYDCSAHDGESKTEILKELELARTIDEVKGIKDKAEALRTYARQAGESLEMQNSCAEIKIRAERRIGEFSKELPVARGKSKMTSHDGESFKTDTLNDAGIKHHERYEAIADIPEDKFEEHIATTKESGNELTSVSIQTA